MWFLSAAWKRLVLFSVSTAKMLALFLRRVSTAGTLHSCDASSSGVQLFRSRRSMLALLRRKYSIIC